MLLKKAPTPSESDGRRAWVFVVCFGSFVFCFLFGDVFAFFLRFVGFLRGFAGFFVGFVGGVRKLHIISH